MFRYKSFVKLIQRLIPLLLVSAFFAFELHAADKQENSAETVAAINANTEKLNSCIIKNCQSRAMAMKQCVINNCMIEFFRELEKISTQN